MIKVSPALQYIARPQQTESGQAVSTPAAKLEQWVYTQNTHATASCLNGRMYKTIVLILMLAHLLPTYSLSVKAFKGTLSQKRM